MMAQFASPRRLPAGDSASDGRGDSGRRIDRPVRGVLPEGALVSGDRRDTSGTRPDLQAGLVGAGRRRHPAAVLLARECANESVRRRVPAQRARLAPSTGTASARRAVHATGISGSRFPTRSNPTRSKLVKYYFQLLLLSEMEKLLLPQ